MSRIEIAPDQHLAEEAIRRLASAGCVMPRDEVEAALEAWGAGVPDVAAKLGEYVERRRFGEPPAYILGGVSFLGDWVRVGPGAFVPRPWTAAVCLAALDHLGERGVLVDVGTGAGAIAMAAARARPGAEVWATELDPDALTWAHRNLDSVDNVTVLAGSLLAPLPADLLGRVDVIVGCLPYVPASAINTMPRDFREHEPPVAFDGGPDGLRLVEGTLVEAPQWLRTGGRVVLEIGAGHGQLARQLARDHGYGRVEIGRDEDGDDAFLVAGL